MLLLLAVAGGCGSGHIFERFERVSTTLVVPSTIADRLLEALHHVNLRGSCCSLLLASGSRNSSFGIEVS